LATLTRKAKISLLVWNHISSIHWILADYLKGIWRNKEDSKRGSSGKDHRVAMLAAMEIYEAINFKIVSLRIGDGAKDWEFEGEGAF